MFADQVLEALFGADLRCGEFVHPRVGTVIISPLKKPSLAFSAIGWPKQVSANLTNSLALSEPAEFGGTSLCRTQPVFQRAVMAFGPQRR